MASSSQGTQLQVIIMTLLVQLVVVMVVELSPPASAAPPTEAELKNLGCTNRCGNLSISYPFGVEDKCYLNKVFQITCKNTKDNNSQPYLMKGNVVVTNLSLEEGELRILNYISRDCYDQFGEQLLSNHPAWLSITKFSISNSKNKFTAIGCDTWGYVQIINKTGSVVVATGCQSQCSSIDSVPKDGSCSGIGCCQTSIPKGFGEIKISANSFFNHQNITDFNPCSYAFVVEEGAFNFSTTNLQNFTENQVPLVLDWGIGDNETCKEAKRNTTSYACGNNTACHDVEDVGGYICKCSSGYKGNPYLSDGCRDINECEDPSLNKCEHKSKCDNTEGNYTCVCPSGSYGDGRVDGNGCTADQFPVIKIMIGFIIGGAIVLGTSSWLYWIFRKRKSMKRKDQFILQNRRLILKFGLERSTQEVIKTFTSDDLKKATNNYDESNIVGRGVNGIVYQGTLEDKRIVAIRKSKSVDESQVEKFINEIVVLSQINHPNVVELVGCCLDTQVPLLVYEFITKGTLFDHIHNKHDISWQFRLQIAIETAGALSHLHSERKASVPIIHRDVKTTNILLDDNYTAKLSDFRASRLVPKDKIQFATVIQGTLGYLDPEYLQTSQLTEKSDVYSFGVVLAELITGKKALAFDRPEEERCLATYFLSSLKTGRLNQAIDKHIENEGETVEQLKKVADIAERCLKLKMEERPTMKDVAMELGSIMKKMGNKHPQVETNIDVISEETDDLLGQKKSSGYEFEGCSSNTTTTE